MKTGTLHFDELPGTLKRLGYPNDIPICEGQYDHDIDVREEMLDPDLIQKTKEEEQRVRVKFGLKKGDSALPMGFNAATAERLGGKIIWDDDQ